MPKKIALAVHIGHGKTTLTAAVVQAFDKAGKETKTIQEIIEEEKSIKITAPPEIPMVECDFKTGRDSRRIRRAKERNAKKKRK